jgi:hypothetical protein
MFPDDYAGGTQTGGRFAPTDESCKYTPGAIAGPSHGGNIKPFTPKRPLVANPSFSKKGEVKSFVVNFDLPPEERWRLAYEDPWMQAMVGDALLVPHRKRLAALDKENAQAVVDYIRKDDELWRECEYIAKAVGKGLTAEEVAMTNGIYEIETSVAKPACSSIVVAQEDGTVIAGKNYDMLPKMADMMFEAIFTKGGKELYSSVQIPTVVGIHTGFRFGEYHLTQNTVFDLDTKEDRLKAYAEGGAVFMIKFRKYLETISDYSSLVAAINKEKWVASHFITIAGKKNEGCIVKTSPVKNARFQHLAPKEGIWFLYQCNNDWSLPSKDNRRGTGVGALDSIGQADISEEKVMAVLQKIPVCNWTTDYHWVCTPSKNTRRYIPGYEAHSELKKTFFGKGCPYVTVKWLMDGGMKVFGADQAAQDKCTNCFGPMRLYTTPTFWMKKFKLYD